MEELIDDKLFHRQLAVLRPRCGAAVPVPGQGRDDADGHVHHRGLSAEREAGRWATSSSRSSTPKCRRRKTARSSRCMIPAKAKNKADAHTFLAFMETPEISARTGAAAGVVVGEQQVAGTGRSDFEDRLPDSRQHEGRHRAVLRSRHDEGNGGRRHEGRCSSSSPTDRSSTRARAARSDAQAHLQEVSGRRQCGGAVVCRRRAVAGLQPEHDRAAFVTRHTDRFCLDEGSHVHASARLRAARGRRASASPRAGIAPRSCFSRRPA